MLEYVATYLASPCILAGAAAFVPLTKQRWRMALWTAIGAPLVVAGVPAALIAVAMLISGYEESYLLPAFAHLLFWPVAIVYLVGAIALAIWLPERRAST